MFGAPRNLRVVTGSLDMANPCNTYTTDLTGLVELSTVAASSGTRVEFRTLEWDTSMCVGRLRLRLRQRRRPGLSSREP